MIVTMSDVVKPLILRMMRNLLTGGMRMVRSLKMRCRKASRVRPNSQNQSSRYTFRGMYVKCKVPKVPILDASINYLLIDNIK